MIKNLFTKDWLDSFKVRPVIEIHTLNGSTFIKSDWAGFGIDFKLINHDTKSMREESL